jgi:OOP family OmpA-OmpF porin
MEQRIRTSMRTPFFGLLAMALISCSAPPPMPVYAVSDRGGDRDEDGVADIDDGCPDDPEDGLPLKANDGCPAGDPDNDGVDRFADRCPDAKEDGLPPDAGDGCPSNDVDGDGVADAKDRCPHEREDNLAPSPSDGCPSPDRDHDGIADVIDRCPGQAETFNRYRDDDGCPDTTPAQALVTLDSDASEIYVPDTRRLEFKLDSAELTPETRETIADVARILNEHPEIARVEIEGHASSQGDEKYNLDLTERRAFAVAKAISAMGVAENRLVPIGYGEYCPAIDRGNDVDEPKNRRVLFKVVLVNGVWQTIPRGCWRANTVGVTATRKRGGGAVMAARQTTNNTTNSTARPNQTNTSAR